MHHFSSPTASRGVLRAFAGTSLQRAPYVHHKQNITCRSEDLGRARGAPNLAHGRRGDGTQLCLRSPASNPRSLWKHEETDRSFYSMTLTMELILARLTLTVSNPWPEGMFPAPEGSCKLQHGTLIHSYNNKYPNDNIRLRCFGNVMGIQTNTIDVSGKIIHHLEHSLHNISNEYANKRDCSAVMRIHTKIATPHSFISGCTLCFSPGKLSDHCLKQPMLPEAQSTEKASFFLLLSSCGCWSLAL